MRFMMMVKSSEEAEAGVLPSEAELSEMGAFNEQLMKAGLMLAGEGLQGSSKGARVRISGKKTTILDGPFVEAKELLAGYWVIRADSKEQALDWAKRVPFREGALEVRPLYEPEDFGGEPASAENPQPAPARKPGTRRFMCLLKADKNTEAGMPANEQLLVEMGGLMEEVTRRGALLAGDGLKPTSRGARVHYSGSMRSVVDGPFTESKELIAGYTVLQSESLAEAVEFSRRMLDIHMRGTGIEEGEVEVRQVFELEDFPVGDAEKPEGWRKQELAFRDRTAG
ncbi:MAG TPA: YciI family protein [Polyangiaceae bacterium]|nr:YciI family protein [Polyangiaceae bacterium]